MKSIRLVPCALAMSALVLVLAGCGKSNDALAPANVLDTTPPDAPTNVAGSYNADENRDYMNWAPSTAADVAGYEVWKYSANPTSGAAGVLVATARANEHSTSLPPTGDGGTHWFRVRAIDATGNRSAYSASAAHDLHVWEGTLGNPRGSELDGGF